MTAWSWLRQRPGRRCRRRRPRSSGPPRRERGLGSPRPDQGLEGDGVRREGPGNPVRSPRRGTVPMTVAPRHRASWAAAIHAAQHALQRMASPPTGPSPTTARCAVMPGMPRPRQGHRRRHRAGPQPDLRDRGQLAASRTAGRTRHHGPIPAATLPDQRPGHRLHRSCSVAVRDDARNGIDDPSQPRRFFVSPGFTPTSTREPDLAGPGSGTATSPTCSASAASPCRSYQTARTNPPYRTDSLPAASQARRRFAHAQRAPNMMARQTAATHRYGNNY